jgi:type 1 glutamine amidotransferase
MATQRIFLVGLSIWLGVLHGICVSSAAEPHIVFVTGDDEYGSEVSMPMVAKILEKRHGMKTTVLYAENEKGERDRHGHSIPGLEALDTADLAVIFMRWRALPDDQLQKITDFAEGSKPMVGLRTATHSFKYPNAPNDKWNDGFGRKVWGLRWIAHYGHENSSHAAVVPAEANHPILRGVDHDFWLHSWLYIVNQGDDHLPGDARVLLEGDAIKGMNPGGEKYGERQPLAWTRELKVEDEPDAKKRIFYTSLGHPRDFEFESPRRLLVNGILWALGREAGIPAGGADVAFVEPYAPPDPH